MGQDMIKTDVAGVPDVAVVAQDVNPEIEAKGDVKMKRVTYLSGVRELFIQKYGKKALKDVESHEKHGFLLEDNPNPSIGVIRYGIGITPNGAFRKVTFEVTEHSHFYQYMAKVEDHHTIADMVELAKDGLIPIKPLEGAMDLESRCGIWKAVYAAFDKMSEVPVMITGNFKSSKPYAYLGSVKLWDDLMGDDPYKYPNFNKVAAYGNSVDREFQVADDVYVKGVDLEKTSLKVLHIIPEGKSLTPYPEVICGDGELAFNGSIITKFYKDKNDTGTWTKNEGPRQVRDIDCCQALNVKGKANFSHEAWLIWVMNAKVCYPELDFKDMPDVIMTNDTQKSKCKRKNGEIFYIDKFDLRFVNKGGAGSKARTGVQALAAMFGDGDHSHKIQMLFRAFGMLERADLLGRGLQGSVEAIYDMVIAGSGNNDNKEKLDENTMLATKLFFDVPQMMSKLDKALGKRKVVVVDHKVIATKNIKEGIADKLNKYLVNKVIRCQMGRTKYMSCDPRLDWIEHAHNTKVRETGIGEYKRFIILDRSFKDAELANVIRSPIVSGMNMAGTTPITKEDYLTGVYTGKGTPMVCEFGTVFVSNSTQNMMYGDFDGDTSAISECTKETHFKVYPHYLFPSEGKDPAAPTDETIANYMDMVLNIMIESANNVGKVDVQRRKVYIARAITGQLLSAADAYRFGNFCEVSTIQAMKHLGDMQLDELDKLAEAVYRDGKVADPFTDKKVKGITLTGADKALVKTISALHHRKAGISREDDPCPTDHLMLFTFIDKCKHLMKTLESNSKVKERLSALLPHYELFETCSKYESKLDPEQSEMVQKAFDGVYKTLRNTLNVVEKREVDAYFAGSNGNAGTVYQMNKDYASRTGYAMSLERGSKKRIAAFDEINADIKQMREEMILTDPQFLVHRSPEMRALMIAAYLGKVGFGKSVHSDSYRGGGLFWLFCNPVIKVDKQIDKDDNLVNILARQVVVKLAGYYQKEMRKVCEEKARKANMELEWFDNPLVAMAQGIIDTALKLDMEYNKLDVPEGICYTEGVVDEYEYADEEDDGYGDFDYE